MTLAKKILQGNSDRGLDSMPTLIAEAGVNHEGNLETAKQLIAEATEGGGIYFLRDGVLFPFVCGADWGSCLLGG